MGHTSPTSLHRAKERECESERERGQILTSPPSSAATSQGGSYQGVFGSRGSCRWCGQRRGR
ncbi:unnamed protein product [Spirodela intermedia]|uniref:Uncharacterized protein n=1 Tax=Spirodela intermedia TaxID=51605 RepID=A0A7I8KUA6_SPIIN|nr:unnamed protein product [Spirodela intermedia]